MNKSAESSGSGDPPTGGHTSAEDLFLYVRNQLAPGPAETLLAHAAGCADCGARLDTVSWLHDQIEEWGRSLFEGHLLSEEIVRYADRPETIPVARLRDFERHLYLCETCEADLEMVKGVESLPRDSPSAGFAAPGRRDGSRWQQILSPAPVWSMVAVLVMAIPAVVGIRSLWRPDDTAIRALPQPVTLVSGSERGTGEMVQVQLPVGKPLLLSCEIPVLDDGSARYDGRIEGENGKVIWTMSGLESTDAYGTFLFLVPAESIGKGVYKLVVEEMVAGAAADSFVFEFTVR